MPTMTKPHELFMHELQDVYYAEQQICKKLPTMIEEASDDELAQGLQKHLEETKGHVANLEQVFSELGEQAKGVKCPGIDGIAKEHDEFMKEEQPSPEICDAFLTGAAARVEHYEIASYTGLVAMAKGMGHSEAAELLEKNLRQEEHALEVVESIGERMAKNGNGARA